MHSRYQPLKENLGIFADGKAPNRPVVIETERPIGDLMQKSFNGDAGETLLFLRSITAQEIGTAPENVQREFFALMGSQAEKARGEIQAFAKNTGRADLQQKADRLVQTTTEIAKHSPQAARGTLTPKHAAQLDALRIEQNILTLQLQAETEPMKKAADAAYKKLRVLNRSGTTLTPERQRQVQDCHKAIQDYAEQGVLINQAILRLNTVENFQQPAVVTTAALSAQSDLARSIFNDHPDARNALIREERREQNDPTSLERLKNAYQWLERSDTLPRIIGGEGYTNAQSLAAHRIVSARQRSTSPEERAQLLDVLRLVSPREADTITRQEAQPDSGGNGRVPR